MNIDHTVFVCLEVNEFVKKTTQELAKRQKEIRLEGVRMAFLNAQKELSLLDAEVEESAYGLLEVQPVKHKLKEIRGTVCIATYVLVQ